MKEKCKQQPLLDRSRCSCVHR